MPSTTELKAAFLDSIKPGVVLDDAFFRKLYGWSMTEPDFLERALDIAVSRQVDIAPGYQAWGKAYEAEQAAIDKDVAEWYGKWSGEQREGVEQASGGRNQRSRYQRIPQIFQRQ
ncbi:hypothetical protein [Hominifimenecus sp. rT4P-3]|uniref:hypothetical protein n=1 Tax=Hominifimenecus sp. rT4P-3 TaxID=3242979 RepID=UPI003DA5C361